MPLGLANMSETETNLESNMEIGDTSDPIIDPINHLLDYAHKVIQIPIGPKSLEDANKIKNLKSIVTDLSNAIRSFKTEFEEFKNKTQIELSELRNKSIVNVGTTLPTANINNDEVPVPASEDPNSTDSETLNAETDWILKKEKRKRESSSPDAQQNHGKLLKKKKKGKKTPVNIINNPDNGSRFNVLGANKDNVSINLTEEDKQIKTNKKETTKFPPLPPPIKVTNIKDVKILKPLIESVVPDANLFKIKAIKDSVWKVNTTTEESYKAVTGALNADENIDWYTHENKNTRELRVMCRGLHPTTPIEDIITSLTDKGFKIANAVNILKKTRQPDGETKREGLFLHQLFFKHGENPERVYLIKDIANQIVKIEACKIRPGVLVQCRRCQGYSHTHNHCRATPKCVKCAGQHLSTVCPQKFVNPPKCANCGQAHTANHKDCIIAVELRKIRFGAKEIQNANPIKENKNNVISQNKSVNYQIASAAMPNTGKSYAHAVSPPPNISHAVSPPPNITEMFQQIMQKMSEQNARYTALETRLAGLEVNYASGPSKKSQ